MTPSHEIILVQTAEQRQECYDVRIAVFHLEQKFPLETEIDEPVIPFPNFYMHQYSETLLSFLQNGRQRHTFSLEIDTIAHADCRLAVLKDYRKYKFGRALVLALHEWVRRHAQQTGALGPVKIICHSQLPVKGFYAKFGYEAEGDEFDEDGDPHHKMVLQLPLGPSPTT